MPHPWRIKSEGRPVFCVQLCIWQDDVSGNVSKQWNKHWIFCMTQAGIPKKLLAQEYFTHYICCSPEASVLEQAKAIINAIKYAFKLFFAYWVFKLTLIQRDSIKDGIIAFDSELDEEVMFFLNILFESGDNPMICEICLHIGLRGNKFCPRCNVGGDKKHKVSDSGYESLFHVSLFFSQRNFTDKSTPELDIDPKAEWKHSPRDPFPISSRPHRGEFWEVSDLDRC